jgi:hypothetical protein
MFDARFFPSIVCICEQSYVLVADSVLGTTPELESRLTRNEARPLSSGKPFPIFIHPI